MSLTSNASGKSKKSDRLRCALHALCALCALCCLLRVAPASADEGRYESFRFGQRAMGMGGAVVAYPGEPEASYYNPASLAMQGHGVVFSGGVQLWAFDWLILTGGFRPDPIYAGPQDTSAALTLSLPSSSVVSRSFLKGRHVIALSNYMTRDDTDAFSAALTTDLQPTPGRYDESAERARSDVTRYTGLSYAWRVLPKLSAGLSVFYVTRKQESSIRGLRRAAPDASTQAFDIAEGRVSASDGALVFRLGYFQQLNPAWALGVACTAPSLRLHGRGSVSALRARTSPEPTLDTFSLTDVRTESQEPWQCRVGTSWRLRPTLRLTADLSLYGPTAYQRLAWTRPPDDFGTFDAHFRADVQTNWLANGAIGVEWLPAPHWPVRGGLFTNLSALPDIPAHPTRYHPAKVHLWGMTVSGGYAGEERSINFGADFQWGVGSDVVVGSLDTLLGQPAFARVDRQQYRLVLFVSGVFEFAKAATNDVIDGLE